MEPNLFRQSSLKKLSSPEQLDAYIQVSSPGVWLLLAAIGAVLAGILIWGLTGRLPTTVAANAFAVNGQLVCYLSPTAADDILPGASVNGAGGAGQVLTRSPAPLSYEEAAVGLQGDYAKSALELGAWNVRLLIEVDAPLTEGAVYPVTILTADVRPFDFLLGWETEDETR